MTEFNQIRSFRIDKEVFCEIKALAALNRLTIGGQIRLLLEHELGKEITSPETLRKNQELQGQ